MEVSHLNLRGRASFVLRLQVPIDQAGADPDVQNIIFRARNAEEIWIEQCTAKIGDFRSLVRSVYLRWAILINASELAERR